MAKTNASSNKPLEKKKKSLPDFAAWGKVLLQANEEEALSKQPSLAGSLAIVSTPIGNLGDITLRALWSLSQADAILCEDTRVTGSMLARYGIKKPLISCHDHNEAARVKEVLSRLGGGEFLVFVSDAGTPLVSDPGYRLVRACRMAGFPVLAVPGASAVLTAMACAGLPSDCFMFVGFLPSKTTARRKTLLPLATTQGTLVFYESGPRLAAALADMAETLGASREAIVARELTKLYEEVRADSLGALAQDYAQDEAPKGEIVILVGPPNEESVALFDVEGALREALKTMSLRDAVAAVTQSSGLKKSDVYARALELGNQS